MIKKLNCMRIFAGIILYAAATLPGFGAPDLGCSVQVSPPPLTTCVGVTGYPQGTQCVMNGMVSLPALADKDINYPDATCFAGGANCWLIDCGNFNGRSAGCVCAKSCYSCVCAPMTCGTGSWVHHATGYQRQDNTTFNSTECRCDPVSTAYRCAANYYGSSTNGSTGCTPCPFSGTSPAGTTTVGGCTCTAGNNCTGSGGGAGTGGAMCKTTTSCTCVGSCPANGSDGTGAFTYSGSGSC